MKKLRVVIATMMIALGIGAVFVPQPAFAANCSNASDCINQGVSSTGGTGTNKNLSQIIKIIVNVLLFLIGLVSVIMIIIGGFRYVTSNGAPDQAKAARNTIMYAVIGLVIAILAYAIVSFVIARLL